MLIPGNYTIILRPLHFSYHRILQKSREAKSASRYYLTRARGESFPLVSNAVYYVDSYAVSVDPCTYSSFVISRRGTTRPSFFPSTSRPLGTGDQVYSSCPELCGHTHKTSFFSTYCRTDRTCNYYYSRTDEPKILGHTSCQQFNRLCR